MRNNPQWMALFGLFCAAMAAFATPIPNATCSGGAQLITIPEDSTEAAFLLTCPGFTLAPSLDGKTAVFLDPDGSVSDYVLLANVSGSVEFTFVSDLDTGVPLVPPKPILNPEVVEPAPFVVVATSAAGAELQFTFTSDVAEGSGVPSDSIGIAVLPESRSLTLFGLGSLVILCWHFVLTQMRRKHN